MLWLNLLIFFGAGIGLAFTPCMLPMMPIIVTVILGRHDAAHPISHSRGFLLALFYVLGMAITYSVAGVFAGLSGTLVSGLLQNPWVLSSFALVYVLLAGAMLGFYTPSSSCPTRSKANWPKATNAFTVGRYPRSLD